MENKPEITLLLYIPVNIGFAGSLNKISSNETPKWLQETINFTKLYVDGAYYSYENACANNIEPVSSDYNEDTNTYTAKFAKGDCQICPFKEQCRIQEQIKSNSIKFTQKQYDIDLLRQQMKTEEYVKEQSTGRC